MQNISFDRFCAITAQILSSLAVIMAVKSETIIGELMATFMFTVIWVIAIYLAFVVKKENRDIKEINTGAFKSRHNG